MTALLERLDPNRSGQAYALTVMAPIKPGAEPRLAQVLDHLPDGPGSPLANVPGTHFARWVIVGDVVYEADHERREHLRTGRLLFTSNFDGEGDSDGGLKRYLGALHAGLGGDVIDSIWGHCEGYRTKAGPDRFAKYMRNHQLNTSLFYAAYGHLTVTQVRDNLRTREQLVEFALDARGKTPDELLTAFRKKFSP